MRWQIVFLDNTSSESLQNRGAPAVVVLVLLVFSDLWAFSDICDFSKLQTPEPNNDVRYLCLCVVHIPVYCADQREGLSGTVRTTGG